MSSTALKAPWGLGGRRAAGTWVALLAWTALVATLEYVGAPRVWMLVVLAPLIEEAAFRAGLQEYLLTRRVSAQAANLAVAGAFALVHVAMHGRPEAILVAGPALLIGAAYNRWRQVRWCVLLHAAMNAAWLAVPLLNRAA